MNKGLVTCLDANGRKVVKPCIDTDGRARVIPCGVECLLFSDPILNLGAGQQCGGDDDREILTDDYGRIYPNEQDLPHKLSVGVWVRAEISGLLDRFDFDVQDYNTHHYTVRGKGGSLDGCTPAHLYMAQTFAQFAIRPISQSALIFDRGDHGVATRMEVLECYDLARYEGLYPNTIGRVCYVPGFYGQDQLPCEDVEALPLFDSTRATIACWPIYRGRSTRLRVTLSGTSTGRLQLGGFAGDESLDVTNNTFARTTVRDYYNQNVPCEQVDIGGTYTWQPNFNHFGEIHVVFLELGKQVLNAGCDIIIEDVEIL